MDKFRFAKTAALVLALCAMTAIVAQAQTFTTLTSFDSTDGSSLSRPSSKAVMATSTEPLLRAGPTAVAPFSNLLPAAP
jgi:hypothetical protein